jgi:Icc-related predicted phosphoesterase
MKIICISDTHGLHGHIKNKIPDGDMIIHSGDFCNRGDYFECVEFFNWFGALPHKYKLAIAGNHDIWMEKASRSEINAIIPPGIHYLQDEGVTIEGLNFWGSPVQPEFFDWAFNRKRGSVIQQHWDLIPKNTDVLITHGPVMSILDKTIQGTHVGCANLFTTITEQLKLKLHVFGHIHNGYGVEVKNNTMFVNAAVCGEDYKPTNVPRIIQL